MYSEMIRADAALFTGLGHYFTGMAQIHLAAQADRESDGLRKVAQTFRLALEQLKLVKDCEKRILAIAQPIEYSAYFVRRHEVVSHGTEELRRGLELMVQDLSEGFYPASACSMLNPVLARLMASWDLNARVEGVVTRLERAGSDATGLSERKKRK